MITPGLTANIKFSWDASNNTLQVRSKTPPQFHATGRNDDGSLDYKTIYEGSNNLSYAPPVTVSKITTYMEGSLNYTRLFGFFVKFGGKFSFTHLSNSVGACFLLIKVSKKDNYQFEDKEIRNLPPNLTKSLYLLKNTV